jgi:hypothetical protein
MVDSLSGVAVEKILVSRHNVLIVHTRQRQRVGNAADHAAGGSVYSKGFHHLQSDLIARPGFHTEAVGYGRASVVQEPSASRPAIKSARI